MKKYFGLVLMICSLFFMPLEWFVSLYPDPYNDFIHPAFTGYEIMLEGQGNYLLLFFLCCIIQFLVSQNFKYAFCAIISELFFVLKLSFYMLFKYGLIGLFSIEETIRDGWFPSLSVGYYLMTSFLIIVIVFNMIMFVKWKREKTNPSNLPPFLDENPL